MSDRSFNPQVATSETRSLTDVSADGDRLRTLTRTIEAEIVPRLLMSVTSTDSFRRVDAHSEAEIDDLQEFSRLLLAHDAAVASAFLQILRDRGMPDVHVCLRLLAPAARLLGELWEQGVCDSGQLTLGLVRIHALLQEIDQRL
jgi:MerR family transcriptional regulator, light-induced transcriptional regulator